MPLIEAALRGGAVVLLVLLVALLLRDARRVPAGIFAALFAAGAAAYTVVSASFFAPAPPLSLLPLRMLGMGNPLVFCLFAASLFDDDFRPSWWHALAWLAMVAFGLVACIWIDATPARWAFSALGLACNALGVWYVLAGRTIDLVEERRRLRAALVVLLAVYSVAVITTEITLPAGSGGPILFLANSIGLLTVTLVFAMVLLSVSRDSALLSIPVLLVMMLLSGSTTPLESMPVWLQYLMKIISPTPHFVIFAQDVLYRGADFSIVWPEVLAMTIIGAVYFGFALYRFRRVIFGSSG